jgi:transcriptional regulator with XRE-family HTH domain
MSEPLPLAEEIAKRLDAQVTKVFGTVYKFQKALKARNKERGGGDRIKGISTPSIHAYLKAASLPSVEFLMEAAAVLGVRPAWLFFGEEPPTEAEAKMQEAQPQRPSSREVVESSLREVFPTYDQLDYSAQIAAMDFVYRLGIDVAFADNSPAEIDASLLAAARFTGHNLSSLLSTLSPPEGADKDDVEAYVVLMCQALSRLVPSSDQRIQKKHARKTAELLERLSTATPDPELLP